MRCRNTRRISTVSTLSVTFDYWSIKITMLSQQHPLTKSHTQKSCTSCCRFFPRSTKLPRQSICAARGRKLGNLRRGAQEWPLVLKLRLHQSYDIQNENTDGNFYTQPRTTLTLCRYGHNPHTNGAQRAGSDSWAERNASTYDCCTGTHLAKWTAETGHPWDNLLEKMHLSERCWEEHAKGLWPRTCLSIWMTQPLSYANVWLRLQNPSQQVVCVCVVLFRPVRSTRTRMVPYLFVPKSSAWITRCSEQRNEQDL